jgi:Ferritin-like
MHRLTHVRVDWDNFNPSTLTFSAPLADHTTEFLVEEALPVAESEEADRVAKLVEHLQAAVSLELKTIPLYLYAAYSIKKPGPASWSIMSSYKILSSY